jgi:general secretion pathway protein C
MDDQESTQMVTMAKGGPSILLFNLQKMLHHRITVLSITALLAFYVLWQAGSLVWKFWLLEQESTQAAALAPSSSVNRESESFEDLLRYPLIRSASNSAAGDASSTDAPKTSLNLKLVGLMYSTDKRQARAIIESEQEGARSYSTHERVADKAEIYRIETDRVILLHAGRREALLLDPEQDAAGDQAGADARPTDDAAQNPSSAELQAAASQGPAKGPRKLDDVMRDFSATPVLEDGEMVGFRLEALRQPEIMSEWGIGPDDVITAVNGTPLNSQGRIMVLFDKLKRRREFELTLSNGGDSRIVTIDLDE